MVKLVDMPDLGSGAARRVGSSPITRTKSSNAGLGFFIGSEWLGLLWFRLSHYPHRTAVGYYRVVFVFYYLCGYGLQIRAIG